MSKNNILKWTLILALIILLPFWGFSISVSKAADDVVPPIYQWIKESNPWDELTEDERDDIVPYYPDGYTIQNDKLTIYYPTQNIDVEFLYRKSALKWPEHTTYDVSEQIYLSISYYSEIGTQLWSNIQLGGGLFNSSSWFDYHYYQPYCSIKYTDVYFINDGQTLCWNITCDYNATKEDFLNSPFAANYTIEYIIKIDNYKNDSLFFEIDTTISFHEIKSNTETINLTINYAYDLFDIIKFQMIYPENMTTGATSGWYKIGEYDVMAIITADQGKFTYDNGTQVWKDLLRGMNIVETPPELNPDIKPYGIIYQIYLYNIPINSTNGNITEIYYDPLMIGFYEARADYTIQLIIVPISVILMVYYIQYKKKHNKEIKNKGRL